MAMTVRQLIEIMQDIGHLDDPVRVVRIVTPLGDQIDLGPVVAVSAGDAGDGPFNLVVSDGLFAGEEDSDG